jgi:hypothetical protein
MVDTRSGVTVILWQRMATMLSVAALAATVGGCADSGFSGSTAKKSEPKPKSIADESSGSVDGASNGGPGGSADAKIDPDTPSDPNAGGTLDADGKVVAATGGKSPGTVGNPAATTDGGSNGANPGSLGTGGGEATGGGELDTGSGESVRIATGTAGIHMDGHAKICFNTKTGLLTVSKLEDRYFLFNGTYVIDNGGKTTTIDIKGAGSWPIPGPWGVGKCFNIKPPTTSNIDWSSAGTRSQGPAVNSSVTEFQSCIDIDDALGDRGGNVDVKGLDFNITPC